MRIYHIGEEYESDKLRKLGTREIIEKVLGSERCTIGNMFTSPVSAGFQSIDNPGKHHFLTDISNGHLHADLSSCIFFYRRRCYA